MLSKGTERWAHPQPTGHEDKGANDEAVGGDGPDLLCRSETEGRRNGRERPDDHAQVDLSERLGGSSQEDEGGGVGDRGKGMIVVLDRVEVRGDLVGARRLEITARLERHLRHGYRAADGSMRHVAEVRFRWSLSKRSRARSYGEHGYVHLEAQ
jgi:hypothetical protein